MSRSPLANEVAEVERRALALAAAVDPDDVPASEAGHLYRQLDRAGRAIAAAKTLLARRVDDSMEWRRQGYRSAAEHLAATAGASLGAARSELDTSTALRELPAVRAALVEGTISAAQGSVIADAARAKGVDVAHVTSLTRGPTQAMRYALLWTSPTCAVEGCSRTIVEYDHCYGAEFRSTHHTRLDQTDPVCPGHHDLRTFQGWALLPGRGKRPMVPPDDPRHPGHGPP